MCRVCDALGLFEFTCSRCGGYYFSARTDSDSESTIDAWQWAGSGIPKLCGDCDPTDWEWVLARGA